MKPWDPKGKALLKVSHTTRLEYSEPVVEAHSEVRKSPVDTGLQKVVTHEAKSLLFGSNSSPILTYHAAVPVGRFTVCRR